MFFSVFHFSSNAIFVPMHPSLSLLFDWTFLMRMHFAITKSFSNSFITLYVRIFYLYLTWTNKIDTNRAAPTQGPGGRASGTNGGGTGNMGTANGGNNVNGMDKSRTPQANSGDMSSSNRPSWFYPSSMNSVKSTTNLGDIALLSICILVMLMSSL